MQMRVEKKTKHLPIECLQGTIIIYSVFSSKNINLEALQFSKHYNHPFFRSLDLERMLIYQTNVLIKECYVPLNQAPI